MAVKRQYAAFLSYSHKDERWARWLRRNIEQYRVPDRLRGTAGAHGKVPERLRPVFRDRDELPAGSSLSDPIRTALAESRFLIVICSPAAARSKWVAEEILEFKRTGGSERILCLIVDGDPVAGGEQECFPEPLRFELDDRGELTSVPVEPIAADVRPGNDGKSLARLKILAGMLGVGLDDLRQREQLRKQRNLAYIAGASLAGMLIMGWLAWTAVLARGDAERRQQQAENLVDFMLNDLHAELQSVGRLDAMSATAEMAMSYFASLNPRDLTEEALEGRAKALRQIGDIHRTQFEYDEAATAFAEALRMDKELLARAPDNDERRFNLGQSEFWVGYVLYEKGDYPAALDYLQRYYEISRTLYDTDPANVDWLMELVYAHNNLAAVYRETGELRPAMGHMTEAIRLNRVALERQPDDTYLLTELAASLSWMGTVQRGNGQLNDSVENRRASRELYEALLVSDPDNAQLKDQLAYAWRGEGLALSLVGRGEHAVAAYNNALAGFNELVIIDPGNSRWARDRMETISESIIAQLAADMPELHGAQELVEALQGLERLSDAGNGDVSPQRLGREALASALTSLFHVPELSEIAARQVEQSFTTLQGLQANNAADLDINLWLLQVALLSTQVGPGLPEGELRSIVDSFSELAGSIEDPIYLSAQARAWFMLSDVEKAEPLVRKLLEAGYRSRRFDRECRHAGVCRT